MEKVRKYAPPRGRKDLRAAEKTYRRWAEFAERHARQAQTALEQMVKGRTVRLAYDTQEPKRDRYDRLLVYVTVGNTDVNAEMLKRGLAVAETRYSCDRLDRYVKLWRAAQKKRVGMWSAIEQSGRPERTQREPAQKVELWASRNSDKYHLASCRWAKRIDGDNLVKFHSVQEAKSARYEPCGVCKPPR